MRSFATRVLLATSIAVSAGSAAYAAPRTPPPSERFALKSIDAVAKRATDTSFVAGLVAYDAMAPVSNRSARKVAARVEFDASVLTDGTWEVLDDGGRVCRLRVESEGASFLALTFSDFDLADGAELYFVSEYQEYHDGPYTSRHGKNGRFGTPMIAGDAAVIELYLPPGVTGCSLTIESISHGHEDAMRMERTPARRGREARRRERLREQRAAERQFKADGTEGGRFGCQVDIGCPEGAPFVLEKGASAQTFDGSFICSGQLVNNTTGDGRLLYLTAEHCESYLPGVVGTLVFYWDYENVGCSDPDSFPSPLMTTTGATALFATGGVPADPLNPQPGDDGLDFALLEVDGTDFGDVIDPYWLGWNRGNDAPTAGATIGYPADKPMQIAIALASVGAPLIDCAANPSDCLGGFGGSFGQEFWRVEDWEVGLTEGGSSGGCLLDQDRLLVGVLTGGVGPSCQEFEWDEFSKLGAAWAGLQPFLDPGNLGAVTLQGRGAGDSTIVTQLGDAGWFSGDTRSAGTIAFAVDPTGTRGAMQLTTTIAGADKATLDKDTAPFAGTDSPFAAGLVLSYAAYRQSDVFATVAQAAIKIGIESGASETNPLPSAKLEERFDKILVYEPYFNGVTFDDVWKTETITATQGLFWLVNLTPSGTSALPFGYGNPADNADGKGRQASLRTLAEWKVLFDNANLAAPTITSMQIGIGSGNPELNAYVDFFTYSADGGQTQTRWEFAAQGGGGTLLLSAPNDPGATSSAAKRLLRLPITDADPLTTGLEALPPGEIAGDTAEEKQASLDLLTKKLKRALRRRDKRPKRAIRKLKRLQKRVDGTRGGNPKRDLLTGRSGGSFYDLLQATIEGLRP